MEYSIDYGEMLRTVGKNNIIKNNSDTLFYLKKIIQDLKKNEVISYNVRFSSNKVIYCKY